MRKSVLLAVCASALLACPLASLGQGVARLTTQEFRQKVYDYRAGKQWSYKGKRPCVIDFYATWCGPCKQLSPRLERLSAEYAGRVDFYKVDVDREGDLAGLFGIHSVPSLLFVPVGGSRPSLAQGALPDETLREAIRDVLAVTDK